MSDDADRYCFDLVRGADKDRFLSSLFAPDDKRPQLHALYAFNIEISRIRELVSEPTLGEIRLAWWDEALEGLYGGETVAHPVIQALGRTVGAAGLPRRGLANLIEARRFDLYDDPMPSLGDLEGYLGETSSALIQLASLVLAGRAAEGAAEAAGLAGVAYGIAGIMRSAPNHRVHGRCFVPKDILGRHGLEPADVLSGRWDRSMKAAWADLAAAARARLASARAHIEEIPSAAMPAFLPVALTELYLHRLTGNTANPLVEDVHASQLRRQWRMWRAARRARF